MRFSIITSLALTGLAAAAPNTPRYSVQSYNANFDDISVPLPLSLQPIGVYDGLEYAGFDVINIGNGVTGVAAQSSPNVAVQYALSSATTSGLAPTASLQTTGNTAYFALSSFYFGCVASSQETIAGVPIACSITVTGIRNGATVATENFSFTPVGLLSKMEKVTFSAGAWKAVDEVQFTQTTLLSTAISVLYDNLQYTTISK